MSDMNDFNSRVIEEFRANNGVVGGPFEGLPMVLLHSTGAKSGVERINPLACLAEGDRLYVFASKAGADTHPDWYFNIIANSRVTVERGTESFAAVATPLEGAERERVYSLQAEAFPGFAEYQAKTSRVIPVIELTREK